MSDNFGLGMAGVSGDSQGWQTEAEKNAERAAMFAKFDAQALRDYIHSNSAELVEMFDRHETARIVAIADLEKARETYHAGRVFCQETQDALDAQYEAMESLIAANNTEYELAFLRVAAQAQAQAQAQAVATEKSGSVDGLMVEDELIPLFAEETTANEVVVLSKAEELKAARKAAKQAEKAAKIAAKKGR